MAAGTPRQSLNPKNHSSGSEKNSDLMRAPAVGKVLPSTRCPATWRLQMEQMGIQRVTGLAIVTLPHKSNCFIWGPHLSSKPSSLPSATLQAGRVLAMFPPELQTKGGQGGHSAPPQGLGGTAGSRFFPGWQTIPVTSTHPHLSLHSVTHAMIYTLIFTLKF